MTVYDISNVTIYLLAEYTTEKEESVQNKVVIFFIRLQNSKVNDMTVYV